MTGQLSACTPHNIIGQMAGRLLIYLFEYDKDF